LVATAVVMVAALWAAGELSPAGVKSVLALLRRPAS
jgi:hypothetical protein